MAFWGGPGVSWVQEDLKGVLRGFQGEPGGSKVSQGCFIESHRGSRGPHGCFKNSQGIPGEFQIVSEAFQEYSEAFQWVLSGLRCISGGILGALRVKKGTERLGRRSFKGCQGVSGGSAGFGRVPGGSNNVLVGSRVRYSGS